MNKKAIIALAVPFLVMALVLGKNIVTLMSVNDDDFSSKGGVIVEAREFSRLIKIEVPLAKGEHAIAVALKASDIKSRILKLINSGESTNDWIAVAMLEEKDKWKVIFREREAEAVHLCKMLIDSTSGVVLKKLNCIDR